MHFNLCILFKVYLYRAIFTTFVMHILCHVHGLGRWWEVEMWGRWPRSQIKGLEGRLEVRVFDWDKSWVAVEESVVSFS